MLSFRLLLVLTSPARCCPIGLPKAGLTTLISKHGHPSYLKGYGGRWEWKVDHRQEEGPEAQEAWPPRTWMLMFEEGARRPPGSDSIGRTRVHSCIRMRALCRSG